MGKGPVDDPNKKKADGNPVKGKYEIGDDLIHIDLGGGVLDKGVAKGLVKGIYKNLGSIRSARTGYTILTCLDYISQSPKAVFYLPFPDSIFVPAETSWSDSSEDGLAALMGKATEAGGQAQGNLEAMGGAAGQAMAKKLADYAPAKAAMRTIGIAYNPNNQMYFNGVNFSGGTFTFKLVPKNAIESAVMYSSARTILHLSLPGSRADGVMDILKEIWASAQTIFTPSGDDKAAAEAAKREAEKQQEILAKAQELRSKLAQNGAKYISTAQPAFFSYPPLWDISFHIPTDTKDKTIFEWCRLALENVRLDVGSGDVKWHSDGMPVSINMTLQVKETILKYSGNINDVMPVILI